jgi:hypothetical protein
LAGVATDIIPRVSLIKKQTIDRKSNYLYPVSNNNPPIQGKKAMSGEKIEEIKFPMLK